VSFARTACSALAPSLVFVVLPEAQLRIIAWSLWVGCAANEPGSAAVINPRHAGRLENRLFLILV
jgi:hypothetical protein